MTQSINDFRSDIMKRAIEVAKASTEGSWKARISQALRDVWAAAKAVLAVKNLPDLKPVSIKVPDKVISVAEIQAHFDDYKHHKLRVARMFVESDINKFEQYILAMVTPLRKESLSKSLGRTKKGLSQTKANLTIVTTAPLLKVQGHGNWFIAHETKNSFTFRDRNSHENLTIGGISSKATAWALFYKSFQPGGIC